MYVPAPPAPNLPASGGLAPFGIYAPGLDSGAPQSLDTDGVGAALATTLSVRSRALDVLDGHPASVSGTLRAGHSLIGLAGRMVSLQAFTGGRWDTLTSALTGHKGDFVLRFTPRRIGSEGLRLRFAGAPGLRASRRSAGQLNVYRPVQVSWYGGGGALACGGALTSSTMGVASRTLPCGTLVTLRFDGRSVRVPVIDRGPYVEDREFDLTEATKQALGFGDTGEVWSTS
jgi:rare lipoprotein A